MKKLNLLNVLTGFVAGIIITLMVSVIYINDVTDRYSKEIGTMQQSLDSMTGYYNDKVVELGELQNEYDDLENSIYNIMEGEEYDVYIHHGNERIQYTGEKSGIFNTMSKTKLTFK